MATARKTAKPTTPPAPLQTVAPKRAPVKAVKAGTPKPAVSKVDKKIKTEKVKVVRDSFTIPKSEYANIAEMKKRALTLGIEIKKSELIRAGLALLLATGDAAFSKASGQVPTLKTGRPGKG